MGRIPLVLSLFVLLLMPVYASAQTPDRLTLLELEREYAHADEVRAVDALEGLHDNSLHPLQGGALGSPVTGRTGTVELT